MLIFGLLGHGLGWYFFDYISNAALVTFIGSMSVLTAFLYFKKRFLPVKIDLVAIPPLQNRPIALWSWGGFWCTLSGIASFISVSGGIPLQIFLIILQGTKDCFYRLSRCVFLYIESHQSSRFIGNLIFCPNQASLSRYCFCQRSLLG